MGFRDLNRFETQRARFEAYKAWQALTPNARQTAFAAVTDEAGRVKTKRVAAYVSPFGTLGTTMIYLATRVPANNQTGAGSGVANVLRTILATYIHGEPGGGALPNGAITINAKKFKFAKLTLTSVVPGTTRKESRITKALYYKPTVDSVTSPFGQATANQDEAAAVAAIKGSSEFEAFIADNSGKNRYKFTPEGI